MPGLFRLETQHENGLVDEMNTLQRILLAAMIGGSFTAATFAAPVVHDYAAGFFRWVPVSSECPFPECTGDKPTRLDITQSADQVGGDGIQLWYSPDSATPHFSLYWIEEAAANAEPTVLADEEGCLHDFHFATTFAGGEVIGSGLNYHFDPGPHAFHAAAISVGNVYPQPRTKVDLGQSPILGVAIVVSLLTAILPH